MKYLLDTDICIYLIKKQPPSIIERFCKIDNKDIALSTVSLYELKFGVENSQYFEQSNNALNQFCSSFPNILPFDLQAAEQAAKIRFNLKKQGTPIGPYDVQIAAIALSNKLTLVSNNTREFERVAGLKLDNWSS